MKINVTQDDIDQGTPSDPFCCPIALAASRAFSVPANATYDYIALKLRNRNNKLYRTPKTASAFIRAFDHGQAVQPFSFELPVSVS